MKALLAAVLLIVPLAAPAFAQVRTKDSGTSTFDSNDPTRTDPGSARGRRDDRDYRRSGSNGASNGERGTFNSGPNDPPPPYTPQSESGR